MLCPSLWSAVEKKVDLLVKELERHSTSFAAVVISLGRWHLTVTVGTSFVGKVISLNTSNSQS